MGKLQQNHKMCKWVRVRDYKHIWLQGRLGEKEKQWENKRCGRTGWEILIQY